MNRISRSLVRLLDVVNRKGKSAGVRLVQYTGKSPHLIHPKHLLDSPGHDWYLHDLRPADVVLDVGCANGAHTLRAAARCAQVFGCDSDASQLQVARQEAMQRRLANAYLFAWDITGPLPFPDRHFDTALFLDVIEHLHPRVAVLREIRRVLKDDGRLLVSGPNRDTSWRRRLREAGLFDYSDPDHKVEYSRADFIAELGAGGFAVRGELMPVVYDTCWAGLIDALGGLSLAAYGRLARGSERWRCVAPMRVRDSARWRRRRRGEDLSRHRVLPAARAGRRRVEHGCARARARRRGDRRRRDHAELRRRAARGARRLHACCASRFR